MTAPGSNPPSPQLRAGYGCALTAARWAVGGNGRPSMAAGWCAARATRTRVRSAPARQRPERSLRMRSEGSPATEIPDDFSRDFAALFSDETLFPVQATRYAWWALVCAVQLAARHPEAARSPVMQHAIELARAIGGHIVNTPALERVMADGWNAELDT